MRSELNNPFEELAELFDQLTNQLDSQSETIKNLVKAYDDQRAQLEALRSEVEQIRQLIESQPAPVLPADVGRILDETRDLLGELQKPTWRHKYRVGGSHSTGVFSGVAGTGQVSDHAHLFAAIETEDGRIANGMQFYVERVQAERKEWFTRVSLVGLNVNARDNAGLYHGHPYENIAAQWLFDESGRCVGTAQGMDAVEGGHRLGTAENFIAVTKDGAVIVTNGVSRPI